MIGLAGGGYARPIRNQWNAAAALEHGRFASADFFTMHGGQIHSETRGAIVTNENHKRLLAKMEAIQFIDQFADEFIHVLHVVPIKSVTICARFAVWRTKDWAVDV